MLPAGVPRDAVIITRNLQRDYDMGGEVVHALRGADLVIRKNEFVAIMGPSGSGKSTLLNILAGLERPSAGRVLVDGVDLGALDENGLARYRRGTIGIVFQAFNLLPRYRVVENVAFPLLFAGIAEPERLRRARAILDRLGMTDRAHHRPNQLSGGEMQRTAIARALVTEPSLLLADEPTGNLDTANGEALLAILAELHAKGQTIVLVTHEDSVAARAERVVRMRDGRVAA
jgi:putative ABC transport system ATP-binding protein